MLVTAKTIEDRVVAGVVVANRACCPSAGMRPGVDGEFVRKRRAGPSCGCVTGFARSGEPGGDMVGIGHGAVDSAVTGIAVSRRASVPASDMTAGALDQNVGAR